MTDLTLSFAMAPQPIVAGLLDGRVKTEGIDLQISRLRPPDVFWRQLRFEEFDVSEMSLSSLLISWARGDRRWAALPVFPDRRFFEAGIQIRRGSGITRPEDLKGRAIGIPDYQQTAGLNARGILQNDFGVAPSDMRWFLERTKDKSHGGATGFQPPENVSIETIAKDQSIISLMAAGEIDASVIYISKRTLLDKTFGTPPPDLLEPLFPDAPAEGARAYAKWGFMQANHVIVVRRAILEEHPWVALNLYTAFIEAKLLYQSQQKELVNQYVETGLLADADKLFATDLFPYGIADNRAMLDAISLFSFQQGLTSERISAIDFFAESTHDL